jgi:hypothetical protein
MKSCLGILLVFSTLVAVIGGGALIWYLSNTSEFSRKGAMTGTPSDFPPKALVPGANTTPNTPPRATVPIPNNTPKATVPIPNNTPKATVPIPKETQKAVPIR